MADNRVAQPDKNEIGSQSVLLVDDTPHTRRTLHEIFRGLGVSNISTVETWEQAREHLKHQSYSVIFCCLAGPSKHAVEFVKKVRRDSVERTSAIPIVVIQSGATALDLAAARDAGADEFIVPPLTTAAISAKLKNVVFNKRASVKVDSFVGPDRRRRRAGWTAAERRGGGAE